MLIDTAYIAEALCVSRPYATNTVVKREGFPAPVLRLSQKTIKWRLTDFQAWVDAQAIRAAGRSARR